MANKVNARRLRGHVLSLDCPCRPYRDPTYPDIIVHRVFVSGKVSRG